MIKRGVLVTSRLWSKKSNVMVAREFARQKRSELRCLTSDVVTDVAAALSIQQSTAVVRGLQLRDV